MKCLIFWKWELSAYSPEKFNTFQIATLSKCWIIYLFPIKYFFYILQVSIVTRDEVGAYKPYLWEQSVFVKGPLFREWILTKVHCVSIYCFSPILCEINQLWWILSSTHCRKHFSAIQILREINFGKFRVSKIVPFDSFRDSKEIGKMQSHKK